MLRLNINSYADAKNIIKRQQTSRYHRWVMQYPASHNSLHLNWAEYSNLSPFLPIKWAQSDTAPFYDMLTVRGPHKDYPLLRWVSHINALLPAGMEVVLQKRRAFLVLTQLNGVKRFVLPQWGGDCYKSELHLYKKDVWQWYDEPKQEVIVQDKELKRALIPWYNKLKANAAAWGAVYDGLEEDGFERALQDYIKETQRPEFSGDGRLCYPVPNSPDIMTTIHAEYPNSWGPLCNEVLQDPEHKLYFILVWAYRRKRSKVITKFIDVRTIKSYSAEALWEET